MRSNHFWSLALALAFFSSATAAQQPTTMSTGTSAGVSTIRVHVSYEQSHQPAPTVVVELLSTNGGAVDMRTADGNGSVTFEKVTSGRYRVRVSGGDIETTTSDLIEAGGSIGGPYVTENISVRLTNLGNQVHGTGIAVIVPEAAEKEFKLGSKAMDKKNWEEAKDHFQKAIAAFPKYADAFSNLALAEIQLKDGKDAVESYRSAIEIDPTLQQANLYLGQFYYENKKYKEAEPYLVRSAADQPQSAQTLTALANVQLQNGEDELALTNARKVSSLPDHQKFAISHLIVAQALTGKGKDDEIAKEYETYLKEAPDSPLAPRVKDELAKLKPK
jgi:Tfp pilus assembly protein PilF